MKKDCDIIQDAQDQANAINYEEDISNDQMIDDEIELKSKGLLSKALDKWMDDGDREVSKEAFDKYMKQLDSHQIEQVGKQMRKMMWPDSTE